MENALVVFVVSSAWVKILIGLEDFFLDCWTLILWNAEIATCMALTVFGILTHSDMVEKGRDLGQRTLAILGYTQI